MYLWFPEEILKLYSENYCHHCIFTSTSLDKNKLMAHLFFLKATPMLFKHSLLELTVSVCGSYQLYSLELKTITVHYEEQFCFNSDKYKLISGFSQVR